MIRNLILLFVTIVFFACRETSSPGTGPADNGSLEGFWYEKPLRIQQTVLRQPDAAGYNVDSVVSYLKKIHANVLVINAGGVVDFFQNTLPLANVNPYLGDRDLLAEVVDACHRNNIKVIARVDFRGVEEERYEQHPEWFGKDENGDPLLLTYTRPVMYAPCYNSYYRNEHAVSFISNLFAKYRVDGIWHNAVNFHQTCYCERCRGKFNEYSGLNIPGSNSPENQWEIYYRWKAVNASEQLTLMRNTVKSFGQDKAYTAEVFNMFDVNQQKHTGIDLYSAAEFFDFLVTVSFIADNRVDVEYKDLSYGATIIKFLKALNPEKSPVILFGGNGTEHRYIYDPPIDLKQWLWEAAANGGGFWNCYFNGSHPAATYDNRNAYLPEEAYRYLHENEKIIGQLDPVKDVAIYYSKASAQLLGDQAFSLPIRGMIRMLHDAHQQYGFVSDYNLSEEDLEDCKVLILPNVVFIDEAKVEMIRNWVRKGGRLIATHETSLYDEQGDKRDDFLMKDIFGAHFTGQTINTEMDSYQKVITNHDLLAGFEKTNLIHNGGYTLLIEKVSGALTITGYLPTINNQPPEHAFPENWETEHPVILLNEVGDGRVIYFANQPGYLNHKIGHPDYHNLLTNAVDVLLGKDKTLTTKAPSSVHIYLNKSRSDERVYQLSLVNTTASPGRPMRDLIPVDSVWVQLPFEIASCQLISPRPTEFSYSGRQLDIARLDDFAALIIKAAK